MMLLVASLVFAAMVSGIVGTSTYDFIIVGGGTAGTALATRLTEMQKFQVLMIEAGPPPDSINTEQEVPGLNFFLEGSNLDWNFTTIEQPTLNDRSFLYTRGKCIGGSSVINFLAFNRGSSSVYDYWEAQGNEGWGWNDVYPYFQKYAHFTPPLPDTTNASQITYNEALYSPSAGPLQISYGQYTQPLDVYWYPAIQSVGIPKIQDFNGGDAVGVTHITTTINPADESRSSAYTSYYASAEGRSNFHLLTDTMATKLLLRNVSGVTEAYGVQYQFENGTTGEALASKEVIVSAGSVQGPQLFMLSGIGPEATLNEFGIEPYQYLPGVGSRFQDHPAFYVNVEVPSWLPTAGYDFPTELEADLTEWQTNHTGPLASTNGDIPAFKRYNNTFLGSIPGGEDLLSLGDKWPNIEFLLLPAYDNPGYPNPPNATGNYITIAVALVSPSSLGSVSISSTNIYDQPVINVNYYDTTADQMLAVAGLQDAIAATESAPFAGIYLGRDKVFPTPDLVATYADSLEYVRNTATTVWHASGTMPMLPLAQGGVVNDHLQVYGVKNLRVVDASIQPRITNQHVQAVVYMIAEKAADLLKAQYA